jgi:hypothetical protein
MTGRPPAQPPSGPPAPLSSFPLSLLPPMPSWLVVQLLPKLPIPAQLPRTSGPWLSWPTRRCRQEHLLPPPPAHRPRLEPTRLPYCRVCSGAGRGRGGRGVRGRGRGCGSSAPLLQAPHPCFSARVHNSCAALADLAPQFPLFPLNSPIFPLAALICS